jgi:hypothetical protein
VIWFLIWFGLAIYAVASLCIIIWAGARGLFALLPPDPETVDRLARQDWDRELVRLGKVPGYRG